MSGRLVVWGARRGDRLLGVYTAQQVVAGRVPAGGRIVALAERGREVWTFETPLRLSRRARAR